MSSNLYRAALFGDIGLLERLIEQDADVNDVNAAGNTALHAAVIDERPDIVQLLIDGGADINGVNKMGQTPLSRAVRNALLRPEPNIQSIKTGNVTVLLAAGADPNAGAPVIFKSYMAVKQDHHYGKSNTSNKHRRLGDKDKSPSIAVFLLEQLIQAGMDLERVNAGGTTVLHDMCNTAMFYSKDALRLLLKHHGNPNIVDVFGQTPLHHCMLNPDVDIEVLKIMKKAGCDFNRKDWQGQPPLYLFFEPRPFYIPKSRNKEYNRMLEWLLEEGGADIDQVDNYGYTPRDCMSHTRDHEIISGRLIYKLYCEKVKKKERSKQERTSNIRFDYDGNQELNWGHSKPNTDYLTELIDELADADHINRPNREGHSLLHRIAKNRDVSHIPHAVDAGADINKADICGHTPLHLAVFEKEPHEENAKSEALLQRGSDPNMADEYDSTALHMARSGGVVSMLIKQGACVDVPDIDGDTPLHLAHSTEKVKALLGGGATWDVMNRAGQTVLFKLIEQISVSNHVDIAGTINALVNAGADISRVNKDGLNALMYALSFGTKRAMIVAVLLVEHGAGPLEIGISRLMMLYSKHSSYPVERRRLLEEMLKAGFDPTTVDPDSGNPFLHQFCILNTPFTDIGLLLEYGADVNMVNKDKETPLTVLLNQNPRAGLARLLLENGASADVEDKSGNSLPSIISKLKGRQLKNEFKKLFLDYGLSQFS